MFNRFLQTMKNSLYTFTFVQRNLEFSIVNTNSILWRHARTLGIRERIEVVINKLMECSVDVFGQVKALGMRLKKEYKDIPVKELLED